jgi:chromosomal replication initiator protein
VPESAVLDLDELWTRSLATLQDELTGPALRAWLDETRPVGFSQDTVVLAAPHSFAREQLDTRYGTALRTALTQAAGRALNVVVTVRPDPQPEPLAPWRPVVPPASRRRPPRESGSIGAGRTSVRARPPANRI